MVDDGYAQWYADRFWQLMPAIYRSIDAPVPPGANGPLRELINRIGAQAAVLRRSIDRLGENQSIETCDDWAIPYIGQLVATRLVGFLEASAQRLDVANTISYRRWAGTVGLLEELSADIIELSRGTRVVEFFRRLGRTRHQFDPEIAVEGVVGRYTRTPAGGFADLRNAYGASNAATAFDEFAYTADLRAGGQSSGWYNIPNLGVFLWWLQSFAITGATPVSDGSASPCFTFDPTGRDIPLFTPVQRTSDSFGENWVSPKAWELPATIRNALWKAEPDHLYSGSPTLPGAFWVGLLAGEDIQRFDRSQLSIDPERGRFHFLGAVPGEIAVGYSFGFLSEIGAGGFSYGTLTTLSDQPLKLSPVSDDSDLAAAVNSITSAVTIEIGNSLTYAVPAPLNVPTGATVLLRGADEERPVLRTRNGATWSFNGNAESNASGGSTVLVLQGIHFQGADLVLTGSFDSVYLRMMTLDPGTTGPSGTGLATAIDGLPLSPTTLFIEGSVTNLILERCITGPIRTRGAGAIEQLTATECIIQAIPCANLALSFTEGTVSLSRCTVMGPTQTHQFALSESILDSVAQVENPQAGCVRFSAYVNGSNLHAPYRSVSVAANASLFRSRHYGCPEYARLRSDVDNSNLSAAAGESILSGAQNGSEMGVYCGEQVTLLKRGLAIKFEEFMPAGQVPVWIDVN